jgi:transcriptional regulator of acetoin/glycerol metabolism
VADIDFPDELVELERSAWEAAQQGALTAEQAAAVQAGITEFAKESGLDRYTVEMGLKRLVRHPEPDA